MKKIEIVNTLKIVAICLYAIGGVFLVLSIIQTLVTLNLNKKHRKHMDDMQEICKTPVAILKYPIYIEE